MLYSTLTPIPAPSQGIPYPPALSKDLEEKNRLDRHKAQLRGLEGGGWLGGWQVA